MRKPHKGCKEMNGHHKPNHKDKDRHFFKILVGNFRSRLMIPDNFVQHFGARPTGTVTLKSRSGYAFDVEVTNRLGKLVFQTGWKAFVNAHDLKRGDFLVFKYNGFSQFKVLIFDPSCCEKVLLCPLEKNEIEMCEEPVKSSSSCVNPSMKSPESNGKAWTKREGRYFSSSEDQKSHDVPRYIVPNGTKLTYAQKKKLNEKVQAIHSEIPIYVAIVKNTSIFGRYQSLNISTKYCNGYLPFEDETLLLCHGGKSWEVRCCIQKGRVRFKRFLKGWKQFAHDNHLQLGDLCLFEQVKNKKTMNVHIMRGI